MNVVKKWGAKRPSGLLGKKKDSKFMSGNAVYTIRVPCVLDVRRAGGRKRGKRNLVGEEGMAMGCPSPARSPDKTHLVKNGTYSGPETLLVVENRGKSKLTKVFQKSK